MMSLLGEIKRRKVFQVAAVYAVVTWLLVQIVATVEAPLNLPEWFDTAVIVFLAVGFPIAIILSWAFDLTPGGVERTGPAEGRPAETMPAKTGLAVNLTVIGVLALLVVLVGLYVFLRGEPVATTADADDRRSIAVLPLDNLSPDPENAFFADAIHGEILTQLAKIGSLKVISQTSVREYRDSPKNMREIGTELDVATILEGGVQRLGDSVRINVQLIDSDTDEHLWAEIYDRELSAENIFAIQSEMATAIANALSAALSPEEVARLNERATQNTRAYDFYLSGNDYFSRADQRSNVSLAVEMYERAVEEDPQFALAHARLSIAHSVMYWFSIDRTEARRNTALAELERARALQPDLPEAGLATAVYYYRGFRDYEQALAELAAVEPAMPGNSEIYETRAFVHRRLGNWDQAVADMERAIELNPRSTYLLMEHAATFEYLRDYAAAEQVAARGLELEPDDATLLTVAAEIQLIRDGDVPLLSGPNAAAFESDPFGLPIRWMVALRSNNYDAALDALEDWDGDTHDIPSEYAPRASWYGVTLQLAGRDDEAEPYFQAARAQIEVAMEDSEDDPRLHIALGEVLAGLGETDAAIRAAREGMALLPPSRDAAWGPQHQINAIVRVFIPAGALDAAIDELESYLAAPGIWSIEGLLPDPRLDPIRDDPRFQALVERYRRQ